MTPKNTAATKAPAESLSGGSALEALTTAVDSFGAAQAEALAGLLAHSKAVAEEVTELSERPTRDELDSVQRQLDDSRAAHAREATELKSTVEARDKEITALHRARAQDAETIESLRERFRSFEAAAQSIMSGLSVDELAPAPVATPAPAAPAPEPAPVQSATAEESTPPAADAPAPAADDPFDLGLEDLAPAPAPAPEAPAEAPAPAPAGITLPDLEEDPFDVDPTRAKLLATAVGTEDPFDLPEHTAAEGAGFVFNPVTEEEAAAEPAPAPAQEPSPADTAGTVAADPFGFMDIPDEEPAPAVQEAPKVIPVYI